MFRVAAPDVQFTSAYPTGDDASFSGPLAGLSNSLDKTGPDDIQPELAVNRNQARV
jgi:hypothetical protein